jgi:hypothetical protein
MFHPGDSVLSRIVAERTSVRPDRQRGSIGSLIGEQLVRPDSAQS